MGRHWATMPIREVIRAIDGNFGSEAVWGREGKTGQGKLGSGEVGQREEEGGLGLQGKQGE